MNAVTVRRVMNKKMEKGEKLMKICIPTLENNGFESIISSHFGRSVLFLSLNILNLNIQTNKRLSCFQKAYLYQ